MTSICSLNRVKNPILWFKSSTWCRCGCYSSKTPPQCTSFFPHHIHSICSRQANWSETVSRPFLFLSPNIFCLLFLVACILFLPCPFKNVHYKHNGTLTKLSLMKQTILEEIIQSWRLPLECSHFLSHLLLLIKVWLMTRLLAFLMGLMALKWSLYLLWVILCLLLHVHFFPPFERKGWSQDLMVFESHYHSWSKRPGVIRWRTIKWEGILII